MYGIELLYDYLEDHVRAAVAVRERKPLAFGVVCFLFGGLSLFVAQALAARLQFFGFSLYGAALASLWKVVAGFVLVALLHLIVEMGGRRGSASALFVLFGLADLTWAAAVPLVMIAKAFEASSWIMTGIFGGIGLVTMGLKARGLQDNYQMPPARAWLTLSIPYLAVVGLTLVAVSLAVVGLVAKLFHIG